VLLFRLGWSQESILIVVANKPAQSGSWDDGITRVDIRSPESSLDPAGKSACATKQGRNPLLQEFGSEPPAAPAIGNHCPTPSRKLQCKVIGVSGPLDCRGHRPFITSQAV